MSKVQSLRAPFPWFGGKSRAAALIWARFGDVPNYVEPFAGSLAVLLGRPHAPRAETVNDKDAYVANFWRATEADPEAVAHYADWPVNEADLHARHEWLVGQTGFRQRMLGDPDHYDVKIAGWWVWGLCQWIGGGWCRGVDRLDWKSRPHLNGNMGIHRKLEKQTSNMNPESFRGGVQTSARLHRKLVDLRRSGHGVHRSSVQSPRSKVQSGQGLIGDWADDFGRPYKKRINLNRGARGVHRVIKRQMPTLGGAGSGSGRGILRWGVQGNEGLIEWFHQLKARLRRTRICCGDFERILGPSPTTHIGLTAVLLDAPYGEAAGRHERDGGIYAQDDLTVAARAAKWAREHGDNPKLRIALCGYAGEHEMPMDWVCVPWKAVGGYGRKAGRSNCTRERIWFSPHCLKLE